MSWYYYSGRVVRPVMVEKGRSVSVRPNTKVEIIDESTIEFKSLCRRGFFRRTSRPKDLVRPGHIFPLPTMLFSMASLAGTAL